MLGTIDRVWICLRAVVVSTLTSLNVMKNMLIIQFRLLWTRDQCKKPPHSSFLSWSFFNHLNLILPCQVLHQRPRLLFITKVQQKWLQFLWNSQTFLKFEFLTINTPICVYTYGRLALWFFIIEHVFIYLNGKIRIKELQTWSCVISTHFNWCFCK